MHNCKTTRERVTELLLDGVDDAPQDLLVCEECRNEFDALKEALRITTRSIETAAPHETYWNVYHARLKQKLADAAVSRVAENEPSLLKRFFTTSIRVPVPVGVGFMLVFTLALYFGIRALQKNLPAQSLSVVHVPVEVPVIQEKVVTRVVYRKSNRPRAVRSADQKIDGSTLAKSHKVNPTSLIGFKPLDEVKMTVIKGGSPDEK